jgi:hypothetical protein
VTEAPLTAGLLPLPETFAAAALRAPEKSGSDQTQDQCPAYHHRRLAPGQVFQVFTHGSRVLLPKIVGDLFDLSRNRLGQSGDSVLILGPQMFGGSAQGVRDGAELVSKLSFAFPNACARSLLRLLKGILRLIYDLVLHPHDLFASAPTTLLPGRVGLGGRGLGVWHGHRCCSLADLLVQYSNSRHPRRVERSWQPA